MTSWKGHASNSLTCTYKIPEHAFKQAVDFILAIDGLYFCTPMVAYKMYYNLFDNFKYY